MHDDLRERTGLRVAMTGAVYTSAVLSYMTSEVCRRAGDRSRQREERGTQGLASSTDICKADIYNTLRHDAELDELTKDVLKPR